MSESSETLKTQNAWLIRVVLLLHSIAFIYIAFEPFLLGQLAEPDVLDKVKTVIAPGSISLGIIVLAKLVLLGLIPARLRDRLIHWGWRNPLPGSRAFTRYGPCEVRVDMTKLEELYGPLPVDPIAQNQLFYSIYRAHAGELGVLDAHKSYLAARDIGLINLMLFILLPGCAWWATGDFARAAYYAAALFASYVVIAFVAKVYAGRFIENVLSAASN